MNMKRDDQQYNGSASGSEITPAEVMLTGGESVRRGVAAMVAPHKEEKPEEKISIFWRVFGGTLLSIAALIVVTLYNGLNNSITEVRADSHRVTTDLRTDLSKINEARADYIKKDEVQARLTTIYNRLQEVKTAEQQLNLNVTTMKESLSGAKEERVANEATRTALTAAAERLARLEAAQREADEERKKMSALSETVKGLKEKLAARDALLQKADEERKDNAKDLQTLRERLAKIEGQADIKTAGAKAEPKPPVKAIPVRNPPRVAPPAKPEADPDEDE